jgi:aspartyl-tRNA(Asn)/glutamyl-tRNA(Gln) amidotransferase subunit A
MGHTSDDLCFLPLAEASRLLSTRALSPVDLVQAYFDRIAAHDPKLNGYLTVLSERALKAARAAEAEIMTQGMRSPLHGIPYGLKDNFFCEGIPTTAASRLRQDFVPDHSAPVYRQLEASGAILLGKHNTWEYGTGTGEVQPDLAFPIARNPWNTAYFTGGSSSGTGVSVAAGLASFGIGSDTGGSVRVPSSANRLFGLKPTLGRISQAGILPNSPAFDCAGPLTRNVHDAAMVLQAIAGDDPRDRSLAGEPIPDYTATIGAGVAGLRIGFIRSFHERDTLADPEIGQALDEAARIFRNLGAEVTDISLPRGVLDYRLCVRIIGQAESLALHWRDFRDGHALMGKALRDKFLSSLMIDGIDVFNATRFRSLLIDDVTALFEKYDVLLCANALRLVPQLSDQVGMQQYVMGAGNVVFSATGHPAAAVPAGFDRRGLPLSIQLVGNYFGEATLLRAAAAYEAERALPPGRPGFVVGDSTDVSELAYPDVDEAFYPSIEMVQHKLAELGIADPEFAMVERARFLSGQTRAAIATLPREYAADVPSAHPFRVRNSSKKC